MKKYVCACALDGCKNVFGNLENVISPEKDVPETWYG